MSRNGPELTGVSTPQQLPDDVDHYIVGRVDELQDGERIIVNVRGWSIGVFNVGGRFHAMLNLCPHKNGPLCQGNVINWVVSEKPGEVGLDTGRTFITCPWHGYEYDMETGRSWYREDGRVRGFETGVDSGAVVDTELRSGAVTTPADREAFDPVTHRPEGSLTAEVVPLSVEDDYLILSVAGLRKRGGTSDGN